MLNKLQVQKQNVRYLRKKEGEEIAKKRERPIESEYKDQSVGGCKVQTSCVEEEESLRNLAIS